MFCRPVLLLLLMATVIGANNGLLAVLQAARGDAATDDEEVYSGLPEVLQRNHNVSAWERRR